MSKRVTKKLIIKTTLGDLVVALTDESRKKASSEGESLKLASMALSNLLGRKSIPIKG